jgi:O-antigen/teichoic acid export membrane protein
MLHFRARQKHTRNILVVAFPALYQTGMTFIKGVVLTRLLPVHEFGLAVILTSVLSALDMFADAGMDRFIVQHKFGYRRDLIRTSHCYKLAGSLLVGIFILLVSVPVAKLFKAPELWPAIAGTGGVVALRGFVNLNYKLQQRDHRFEAESVIDMIRFSSDLIVTAVAALVLHSYLAALVGFYAGAFGQLVASQIQARGRYSFWPRRLLMPIVARFSTPIYVNATMLFAAIQGDRMVVAAMFTKQQLALYVVACTVGQGLATLTSKVSERLLLPVMIARDVDRDRRRRVVNRVGLLIIPGSYVFLVGVSLFGPYLTRMIYGPAYYNVGSIAAVAAIGQMIQIQQSWLTVVLIANGQTKALPLITMMRATAFPLAILFVNLGMSLLSIPLAFALGGTASLATACWSVRSLRLVDWRIMAATFLGIVTAIGLTIWMSISHYF